MTIEIEVGTGSSSSVAYADAAAYKEWHSLLFGAAPTQSDSEIEAAIRRAVNYMESLRWTGQKSWGRNQALSWPRSCVLDRDGWSIDSTTIPQEVVKAQHNFTKAELEEVGCLAPKVNSKDRQKVLTGMEGMTWTITGGGSNDESRRARVIAANDCLRGLVRGGIELVRS